MNDKIQINDFMFVEKTFYKGGIFFGIKITVFDEEYSLNIAFAKALVEAVSSILESEELPCEDFEYDDSNVCLGCGRDLAENEIEYCERCINYCWEDGEDA